MTDPAWPAPGAGEWIRLADHFDRPWTAEYARIFRPSYLAGSAAYYPAYGLPVRTVDVRTVRGYPYLHPIPLVGPDSSYAAPASLLWLLARVMPALRRCERAAARTLRERPWLARIARWWDDERPSAIAENRALRAATPARMSDVDLADHLDACERLAVNGYRLHFELHGADLFPIGLLLDACRRWGVPMSEVLDFVVGGPAERERTPLEPEDLADTIISGYDIDRPRLCELAIEVQDAVTAPAARPPARDDDRIATLVPREHRAGFDILLDDARAAFPVRDDNGVVLGAWRLGLLRRAYLEAGERLAARGELEAVDHALEADVPELRALLVATRERSVGRDELATRATERKFWSEVDAPVRLGPEIDIPLHALTPAMRTVAGAQYVLRNLILRTASPALEGFGVGAAAVEGVARVVSGADDAITRLAPGDVLVARATSPAFNAVLPLAAGLVTEHGSALSHAAISARELGIAAIVGVPDATRRIADGSYIRVDPVAGRVTVLDRSVKDDRESSR